MTSSRNFLFLLELGMFKITTTPVQWNNLNFEKDAIKAVILGKSEKWLKINLMGKPKRPKVNQIL